MVPALPSSSESSMSKTAAVRWNGCMSLALAIEPGSRESPLVVRGRGRDPQLPAVHVLAVRPRPLRGSEELRERAHARVELVQGVHDHRLERDRLLRRAVLVAPVVGGDQMRDLPLQLAGEAGDARRLLADQLADEHEVADQAAFVGVLEAGLRRDLARLPEVVEQAPGRDQVAIELRVVIADAPAQLQDRKGVLAETAGKRVVD